ncbi:hypothetical protein MHYP_G00128080 [Metynnis hypsauchen]
MDMSDHDPGNRHGVQDSRAEGTCGGEQRGAGAGQKTEGQLDEQHTIEYHTTSPSILCSRNDLGFQARTHHHPHTARLGRRSLRCSSSQFTPATLSAARIDSHVHQTLWPSSQGSPSQSTATNKKQAGAKDTCHTGKSPISDLINMDSVDDAHMA